MGDAALDLSAKPSTCSPPDRVSPLPVKPCIRNTSTCESGRSSSSSVHSLTNDLDHDISQEEQRRRSPGEYSNHSSPTNIMGDKSSDKSDGAFTPSRPFKMYPMDQFSTFNGTGSTPTSPLSPMTGSFGMTGMFDSSASYPTFPLTPLTSHLMQRKRRAENRSESSNEKKTKTVPEDKKDEAYWERRRKNNEAAKRSRDSRRCKEEEIAMRAAFLEQENLKLRAQVTILKNETAKLHYMLYNRL
ncbi:D site-binding protein-like [Argopecten irradians]|uniref:D site-binding protein-like n=1 Tax=Argopecten irradians TaxID=31199 RepID=UPI00371DB1B1